MTLGKEYVTKLGSKYTPLELSECNRFVLVNCKYLTREQTKWFWACHRLFND